jgi:CubicO group peptidase (beta-lactamase class C family)
MLGSLIALSCCVGAATAVDDLAVQLDEYLTRCVPFGFAGSVLVEKDGKVILSRGYGLAERETRRPNTPETIFDIGSLAKQFTAAAILRLEQDGKLSTKDTLAKFFPHCPADKAKIELHHLLTHTSGMPPSVAEIGPKLEDRNELVRLMLGARLESEPGKQYRPTDLGYDLLAAIVEMRSGKRYEAYLTDAVFKPAGLVSTGFRLDKNLPAAGAARGYAAPVEPVIADSLAARGELKPREANLATEGWFSWALRGAGGVLTTVGDLLRWQHALATDAVLKKGAREKLFRPFLGTYAYGWNINKSPRGTRCIEQGGSTGNGFDAKFAWFPDDRVVVIMLGNVTGGIIPLVNLNLGKLIFGETVPPPPALTAIQADGWQRVAGSYQAESGERFTLSVQGDGIVLEAKNASAFALIAPAETVETPVTGLGDPADLLARTETIAEHLAHGDYTPLHAAEDKSSPLLWFETWWHWLEQRHGPNTGALVLGVTYDSPQIAGTHVRANFEHGAELLRLYWTRGKLVSIGIDPPFPSLLALLPASRTRLISFDLLASKTNAAVEVTFAPDGSVEKLELEARDRRTILFPK